MIFLGSKKYPGEAEFEEFLSENGGESNAYTECEYTCNLDECFALARGLPGNHQLRGTTMDVDAFLPTLPCPIADFEVSISM